MKLLTIDTCLGACSAAIVERATIDTTDNARIIAACCERMTTGHAERLFPLIQRVVADATIPIDRCDGIAVTVGPGTFTGVRLGVAAARGLALAAGLPVYAATSLSLIAAEARHRGPAAAARILVTADARNGQVHAQTFAAGKAAEGPPVLATYAQAAAMLDGTTWVAGNGARLVAEACGLSDAFVLADIEPDARHLSSVALTRTDPPLPLYMRPPDAKPQDGKSLARVAT